MLHSWFYHLKHQTTEVESKYNLRVFCSSTWGNRCDYISLSDSLRQCITSPSVGNLRQWITSPSVGNLRQCTTSPSVGSLRQWITSPPVVSLWQCTLLSHIDMAIQQLVDDGLGNITGCAVSDVGVSVVESCHIISLLHTIQITTIMLV